MTITIRSYHETDSVAVGRLIATTFSTFNLGYASPEDRAGMMGPFLHHDSTDPLHRSAIARAISAPVALIGESPDGLVGVLRGGRRDRKQRTVLQSLFVDGGHQRRGIGGLLVGEFEGICRSRGVTEVVLASTLQAVPFYLAQGYKRSTGVRTTRSFGVGSLPYQPMKKTLARDVPR